MPDQTGGTPVQILLVEDNPGDVRLTEEAFKERNLPHNLHVVEDGQQAIAFLRRTGRYSDSVRPDLVLLDLNMPRKTGFEVLEEMNADQRLKDIPVVILTGSAAEEDVLQSYDLRVSGYVIKPLDAGRLAAIAQFIRCFRDDSASQSSR